jgi:hypothetical protein
MMDEYHPELAEYVPTADRPLRRRGTLVAMRVMVILGLALLIVPGVLVTIGVASATAARTCAVYVKHYAPDATGSSAPFQVFSPGGASWLGWQCYATNTEGNQTYITPLGLIPSAPGPFRP